MHAHQRYCLQGSRRWRMVGTHCSTNYFCDSCDCVFFKKKKAFLFCR
uniref:Uncharacterized protein n=1 Tax=Anguilla anguilla TaxID=7936 RepID=A0A0E9XIN2_ANGAN